MNCHEMEMSTEERETLNWCYNVLDEDKAAEIEEEARQVAAAEIHAPEAAEKLLETLVRVIVRNSKRGGTAK